MQESNIRNLIVDDHERGVFRVRRPAFTSQEVFEREREAIFDRTWLYVGHESEVPGPNSYVTRTPGGRPIIVTRDGDGKLHAFLNAETLGQ